MIVLTALLHGSLYNMCFNVLVFLKFCFDEINYASFTKTLRMHSTNAKNSFEQNQNICETKQQ